jgi:predicted aspartyl protease
VTARIDTSSALLVLDTGSFRTFLDPAMAYRARFEMLKDDDDPPFGLDGRPVTGQTANLGSIALGRVRWRDVSISVARLTTLRPEGHPATVDGLLGSDLLKRLGAFEVDFRCGKFRFWR